MFLPKTCALQTSRKCLKQERFGQMTFASFKKAKEVESYKTLGLKFGADQEQVRQAFLDLCKKYHPDSGPQSDSEKFHQVEKAYRNLQEKFTRERWDLDDKKECKEDVAEFDIKHTAPQHRAYLSYDGHGSGTPSQRQQQHQQQRARQAADRVREHRLSQLQQTTDSSALTTEDKKRVDKTKTRFGMERLIEDLIQESMSRGEFDNLRGAGQPLPNNNYNPHVDFITHKMNEIMIDNGFTPEWITLGREIRDDTQHLRKTLTDKCRFTGDEVKWTKIRKELEVSTKALNKKIQLFNLIVPILNRQMLLFRLDKELVEAEIRRKNLPPSEFLKAGRNEDRDKNEVSSSQKNHNIMEVFSSFFSKAS